jgi:hypothetical protein
MIRILAALACPLWGQTAAPPPLYAESFRHGATRVTEKTFEAQLSPQKPVYREPIKDVRGNDRYVLSLAPLHVEGDFQIVSWEAKLADFEHRMYANVLMTSQIPSDDPLNNAWWLDPGKFARVPVLTERIILGSVKPRSSGRGYKRLGSHVTGESFAAQCTVFKMLIGAPPQRRSEVRWRPEDAFPVASIGL